MRARDHHRRVDADVLVVNTCAFIDSAKQESIDAILEMAEPRSATAVRAAGGHRLPRRALSRRAAEGNPRDRRGPRHGGGAARSLGDSSAPGRARGSLGIAGSGRGSRCYFTGILRKPADSSLGSRAPSAGTPSSPTYIYDADTPRLLTTPQHYAYVKIAEGCDYTCAFCIIPTLRGSVSQPDRRTRSCAKRSRWPTAACGSCC